MRWSDIDFERRKLSIARNLVRTNSGLEFKNTKTGEVHIVTLNSLALAALRAHRAVQNEERLRVGDAYHNSDLVFANAIGEPWNPDSVSNAFRKLAMAVNLSTKRLHDVRHTAGTWMLQGGVDIKTVSAVLGHSSPTTTLRTYAHVMPGADEHAVEVIAKRLGGAS